MEFHISRAVRENLEIDGLIFAYTGNVIFGDVTASRKLAAQLNKARGPQADPAGTINAGALFAMGLIDELSHALVHRYRQDIDPAVHAEAIRWFASKVDATNMEQMLLAFVEQFPNVAVYRGELTAQQWLDGSTDGMPNREAALEELMLLWLANLNPAFAPFRNLFDDKDLKSQTVYKNVTASLPDYLTTRPPVAPEVGSLFEALRAPMLASPDSITGQLEFIRTHWAKYLPQDLRRLLLAIDVLREEDLAIWLRFHPPGPDWHRHGAPTWGSQGFRGDEFIGFDEDFNRKRYAHDYQAPLNEYEAFSADQAWMPNVVLIAKSTYVWLEQLSKKYGRHIHRLNQIPDEELRLLADRGITGLWLIGLWERSIASRTIKRLRGQSDAVASAYSLKEYDIAEDLGGYSAYEDLRNRAAHFRIRLASDMVPNHMGIDSPWVIEHPEWFISRWEPPYPAYEFNGPDLSHDGRVEIKIEDHYYNQSDAAVVFRRRDKWTGETRYIYHGNDGTSFPWNDTAQLDYLNPAVREQVMQTILHVARLFPVIRFDAAMTLAKRHFHRLWFPGPGSSGAIPSRAEYGMSQADFDRAMPNEFWREVVDRVAAEVPGTLLLAEAFWLMEGYFVRTLGMHRVYNSAFMVMLRDEDNAKYRSVIKNTLEFDPDIMKRYVNFMSNPDERTAIDQFGKGDKCFGVAVMMSTLPGLPMFGHGQIEGFTEKYGMEYRWPRYEENPDHWLVERHEREIAPLLKRRWLFAESGNFLLYDFYNSDGSVNEDVFAYSNRSGDQRALVVYQNRYGNARGTIHHSAAYADKGSGGLRHRSLGEGLGLSGERGAVIAWRDSISNLEYLRRAGDLIDSGITLDLHAYQYHVFLDWRELRPTAEYPWDRLADWLNGRGVSNINDELVNLELSPVHNALREFLDPNVVRHFADMAEHPRAAGVDANKVSDEQRSQFLIDAWLHGQKFLRMAQAAYVTRLKKDGQPVRGEIPAEPLVQSRTFAKRLRAAMRIPQVEALFPAPWTAAARRMLPSPSPQFAATEMWGPVLGWCLLQLLAESIDTEQPERTALDLFDRLRLRSSFAGAFAALGFEGEEAWRVAARIKVLLLIGAGKSGEAEPPQATTDMTAAEVAVAATPSSRRPQASDDSAVALPGTLWQDPDVRWLCGVHESDGHLYLIKERYEELLWWLLLPSLLRLAADAAPRRAAVEELNKAVTAPLNAADAVGYRIDVLAGHIDGEEKSEARDAVSDAQPAPRERDAGN